VHKRLIMHIGMPKTGSTAIIDFLRRNAKRLHAAGFVFPQQRRVRFLHDEGEGADAFTSEWDVVRQALDKGDRTVLVSDENLYHQLLNRPDRVRAVRAHLGDPEIRVLLYLRRQDTLLESLYREIIRGVAGPVLDPDYGQVCRLMGGDFLDYDAALRFFQAEFGDDKVAVRVFERRTMEQGCLFHDYCAAAGVPWSEAFRLPSGQINKAVDARLIGIFLEINATHAPHSGEARQFKEVLEELGQTFFRTQENRLLSVQARRSLLARFAESNAALARRLDREAPLFSPDDPAMDVEPRCLNEKDLRLLLLGLNRAWVRGVGAVPFWVYNIQKLRYVRLRLASVSGGRRMLLRVQIVFHGLLRLSLALLPRKRDEVEACALHYLTKQLRLLRQTGQNWLPWSAE